MEWRDRKFCIDLFTLPLDTTNRAEPIQNQILAVSSWFPMWVQNPKYFGYPLLFSLAKSRELNGKWSMQDTYHYSYDILAVEEGELAN